MNKGKILSYLLIRNDMDTLIQLLSFVNKKDYAPYFYLGFLPYLSLLSYEAYQYIQKISTSNCEIEENVKFTLKDMRNKSKLFDMSFKKTLQLIQNIDYIQEREFFEMDGMTHCNIGLILDENKHIIHNTHLTYYFTNHENLDKLSLNQVAELYSEGKIPRSKEMSAIAFNNGKYNGQIISSLHVGMQTLGKDFNCKFRDLNYKMMFVDYNTNFNYEVFGDIEEKQYRLLIIHLLSMTNFVLFELNKIVEQDTGLLFRIRYLCCYYVIKSLERIYNNLKSTNKLDARLQKAFGIIDVKNKFLFQGELRSSLMHYGISDEVAAKVSFEKINIYSVLNEVVESITGENFNTKSNVITEKLNSISKVLNEWLGIQINGEEYL